MIIIIIIIIILIIIITIIIIIIIIITYSSGLDTDVEELYTIFILNVNSLKFPLTLIKTNS